MPRPLLTVDLGAIVANWRALAALAGLAECAAVVKADAYGLGAAAVAPALAAAGARTFFAADADECVILRGLLGAGPVIYALGGADADEIAALAEADIRPILNARHQIEASRAEARRRGRPVACALQLDLGMRRLGLPATEACALLDAPDSLDGLDLRLILGHLTCADAPESPTNRAERDAFAALTAHPRLRGVPLSLAATGGVLLGPGFAFDLVRPGIGLYGGLPFAAARPVVSLDLPVLQVRDLGPGDTVGYGRTWRAGSPRRIATLAAGYADGLHRSLSNRGAAWWRGTRLPIVGRISMDLLTVDVTGAPGIAAGDLVELLGPHQTVDALAADASTIGYEALTSLGTRYTRRYVAATPT